jgi:hypothetical protein
MCTVSVVPPAAGRGLRVIVNRDERRTRALAWAPRRTSRERVPVVWPTDAESLGTWIAASGSGLVWALLNLNRGGPLLPRAVRLSRGHIIPTLAGARSLDDACRLFRHLELEAFAPFRLLVANADERAVFAWDGESAACEVGTLTHPELLSSSSLGDHLVERPRQELFSDLLTRYGDPWLAQDHLHQHAWPDRRHLSVLMSRAVARTVSRTVVVVDDERADMTYAPIVDGWIGPVVSTTIERMAVPLAIPA